MGASEVKSLAVIAPRSAEEARAAANAIRTLAAAGVAHEVEVFAAPEARAELAGEGITAKPLGRGVAEALRSVDADSAVLMDPREGDALEARAAGASLRFGWGERLGPLTHGIRPAKLHGAIYRPIPERIYLDLVGLCGALSVERSPDLAPSVPDGRILLRLPNWLGDIIQCEPLLRSFVGAADRLTLVGPRVAESLFGEMLGGAHWLRADAGVRAWRDHDLALLLDGSLRSAFRAACARIPSRVSWARGGKSLFLTDAVSPPRELGQPALGCGVTGSSPRYLARPFDVAVRELASAAGLGIASGAPRLSVTAAGREEAVRLLESAGVEEGTAFVLAALGGRAGSAKVIPAATMSALLAAFRRESSLPVLMTCGPGEERHLALLQEQGLPEGVSHLGVSDLETLAGLLERASAFLSSDSGPRHIAAALGRPAVVLHGPTDPRHSGLRGAPVKISRLQVPCGPCHKERCPLSGEDHMACFGDSHSAPAAAMLCELLT